MTDQRQKIKKIKWKRHEPSKKLNISILFCKKHSSFATACSEKNSKLNDNRLEEQENNITNILLEQRNWKSFKLNLHI